MATLWLGFFVGFFATWVFGMVTRLLPATWVRYRVRIGELDKLEVRPWEDWIVPVTIQPPTFLKRILLMEPLHEHLLVEVRLGDKEWLRSCWIEGDLNIYQLWANAVMTVDALAFTVSNGDMRIAGNDKYAVQGGNYDMRLRVVHSVDRKVAGEVGISVVKQGGEVTAKMVCGQN